MTNSSRSSSPPISSSPGDASVDRAAPTLDATLDATLDICGETCPFTFVRTKLALEALPMGATLRVVVDHEPAVRNIPRSAREWGQEVLAAGALDGEPRRWAIDLRKRVR